MNAARTTFGLWLLVQLLLAGLQGHGAPAPPDTVSARQWHDDAARRDRADFLAEHVRAQRTAAPSADDMLAGTSPRAPHPAGPQAQPAVASIDGLAAALPAAYHARAPPTPA